MATSGTTSFSISRDDLILSALRLTGRFSVGDTVPATDITFAAQALNMLVKAMAMKMLPLWCVLDVAVPLVAGQASYNLSTATASTRPLRVLDAYWRSTSGNDVQLYPLSRYDYDLLGQKASPGAPNQYWYDPKLGAGIITLYNVPADATATLHVVVQKQIQDFNLAVDTPDFPQEAYQMLKWSLADEIALEYSTPSPVRAEIAVKAKAYREEFFDSTQEQVSVTLTPSGRGAV
jgi:hypothetical protein